MRFVASEVKAKALEDAAEEKRFLADTTATQDSDAKYLADLQKLTELQKTANMVGDSGLKIIRQVAEEEWQLRVQDLSVEQLNQLVQKVAAVWGVENLQNIFENSLKLTEDHFLAA